MRMINGNKSRFSIRVTAPILYHAFHNKFKTSTLLAYMVLLTVKSVILSTTRTCSIMSYVL